jgi:hypothetical protein
MIVSKGDSMVSMPKWIRAQRAGRDFIKKGVINNLNIEEIVENEKHSDMNIFLKNRGLDGSDYVYILDKDKKISGNRKFEDLF